MSLKRAKVEALKRQAAAASLDSDAMDLKKMSESDAARILDFIKHVPGMGDSDRKHAKSLILLGLLFISDLALLRAGRPEPVTGIN